MKQKSILPDVYKEYYDNSYLLSLLCAKDVLGKLEQDYSKGITDEESLLNYIYRRLVDDSILFNSGDLRIQTNIDKIIQNCSTINRGLINKIKICLNSCEKVEYSSEPFLRMHYSWRKYGFEKISQCKNKYQRGLSNQFLINYKEQIYDSITFDFRLISAFGDLGASDDNIFEDCLNSYKLFASINYFKLAYFGLFNDITFLALIKSIAQFNASKELQIFEQNCLFDNFKEENDKLLKYINKKLKKI